jgi:hypothetical protein
LSRLHPCLQRLTRRSRDLKLNRPLRLALQHDRSLGDLATVGYVANSQGHQITTTQLAVQPKIEHRELAQAVLVLKPRRIAQTSLGLRGAF